MQSQSAFAMHGRRGWVPVAVFTQVFVLVALMLAGVEGSPAQATTGMQPSWSTLTTLSSTDQPEGITCVSTFNCLALVQQLDGGGPLIGVTTDGGSNWNWKAFPQVSSFGGVSCVSATSCMVVGQGGGGAGNLGSAYTTTNFGATWTAAGGSPKDFWNAVSCLPGTTTCFANGRNGVNGGGGLDVTTNFGATWTPTNYNGALGGGSTISCWTTKDCVAGTGVYTGVGLVTTHDSGATWSNVLSMGFNASLLSVTCTSATFCIALGTDGGNNAEVFSSPDGGNSWTQSSTLPANNGFAAISCVSSTWCLFSGNDSIVTSDGGHSWLAHQSNIQGGIPSCSSVNVCVGNSYVRQSATYARLTLTAYSIRSSTAISSKVSPQYGINPGRPSFSASVTSAGQPILGQIIAYPGANSGPPSASICGGELSHGTGTCTSVDYESPWGYSQYTVTFPGSVLYSPSSTVVFQVTASGPDCASLTGSAKTTFTMSGCTGGYSSTVSVTGSSSALLKFGGTLKTHSSNRTFTVKSKATTVGQGSCGAAKTEVDVLGTVTQSSTGKAGPFKGESFGTSLCETTSGQLSLAPAATVIL